MANNGTSVEKLQFLVKAEASLKTASKLAPLIGVYPVSAYFYYHNYYTYSVFIMQCIYTYIQVTATLDGILNKKSEPEPRLVILTSILQGDPKSAMIIAESDVVCTIKPGKMVPLIDYSIVVLLATYYVFDVKYPKRHNNMFNFFEEKLLEHALTSKRSRQYEQFLKE